HLELEQLHHEFGRGAADEQLRAAGLAAHVEQVAADAVAGAHDVARDRLVLGDEGFRVAAQVDVDVAALNALDHAGHQFADAILPGVHHLLALGLAHALHDHLLGGLRRDASDVDVFVLLLYLVDELPACYSVDTVTHQNLSVW